MCVCGYHFLDWEMILVTTSCCKKQYLSNMQCLNSEVCSHVLVNYYLPCQMPLRVKENTPLLNATTENLTPAR